MKFFKIKMTKKLCFNDNNDKKFDTTRVIYNVFPNVLEKKEHNGHKVSKETLRDGREILPKDLQLDET